MAEAGLKSIGGVEVEIRAGVGAFNKNLVQAEQRARNAGGVMAREFDKADRSASRLDATLKRSASTLALFGGGFAAASLVKGVIDAADAMNLLKGRIANVITEGESLNRVQKDLFNSAQANRASLEGTANLYLRLRQSVKDLNHEQALNLSSTFAKSLVLSGANAGEAASSMLQFSQAMASGRLQGDELRSLLENNARFARALAESLGVTVGQLKALGEAGALTSDLVGKALENSAATISAEFENVPVTVGQAFQQLQNGLLQYISDTDTSLGVTQRIALGIQFLTKNIETLGNALIVLGSALGTAGIIVGMSALTRQAVVFGQAIGVALESLGDRTPSGVLRKRLDGVTAALNDNAMASAAAAERVRVLSAEYNALKASNALGPVLFNKELELFNAGREQEELIVKNRQLVTEFARTSSAFTASSTGFMAAARNMGSVIKNVGASIVSFFGGPLGIALIAFSTAAAIFTHLSLEAEKAKRNINEGLELVSTLNITVSESAAAALGKTAELTKATDAQAKAIAALTAKRREDLRVQLQQAVVDTKNQQEAARRRIAELEGLNNAPFQAQALKDYRQPKLDEARKDFERLGTYLPILEAGLEAVDSGMADLGKTADETGSDIDKAVAKFKQGVKDLVGSPITDAKFKSTGISGMLEKLAETTDVATARKQFADVRNLMTDQDAAKVEKALIRMAKATITTKTALSEFATEAEKFKKAIKDIRLADPSEGNKSRAAVQAIVEYGKAMENIPQAFAAIDQLQLSKILSPADAALARGELMRMAAEGAKAFGTDAQQAQNKFAETLKDINEAEKALIATGQNFQPDRFNVARALALQELEDATRAFPVVTEQMEDLAGIITAMMTPAEKLKEELAEIAFLRAGETEGSAGSVALDRKRVSLLEDEARAAGYAGEALLTLQRLRTATGMTDAEVREMQKRIRDAAEGGRANMRWQELSNDQRTEAASKFFADTFTDALTEGIKTSNFGDALRDVIAQKAAEGLANSIADVGQYLGDTLFGKDGFVWSAVGSLFGTGLPARAEGGPVKAGQAYMTGEKGREVFIPGTDGYIAPNSALRGTGTAYASARGGPRLNIDLSTNIAGDVGSRELYAQMQAEQRAQMRALPGIIKGQFREIQRRT